MSFLHEGAVAPHFSKLLQYCGRQFNWTLIEQDQVSPDKRSGIVNDPNNLEDEQYIVRLIGQVITVSLETVKIVKSLPPLDILAE